LKTELNKKKEGKDRISSKISKGERKERKGNEKKEKRRRNKTFRKELTMPNTTII